MMTFIYLVLVIFVFTHNSQCTPPLCSNFSQFTMQENNIGIMRFKLPRDQVYGFTIDQIYSIKSKIADNDLPTLKLMDRNNPKKIIDDILAENKITVLVDFSKTIDVTLLKISINGEVQCEEATEQNEDSSLLHKASVTFETDSFLIPLLREFLEIDINPENCGKPPVKMTSRSTVRIIGGKRTNLTDNYPWVASVYIKEEYKCVANLIAKHVAISDAGCFDEYSNIKDVHLKLYNGKNAQIWGYMKHENYSRDEHDLSLIFLDEDIEEDDFYPICVWEQKTNTVPIVGEIVSSKGTGELVSILMRTISDEECDSSSKNVEELLQPTQFCAETLVDGTDPYMEYSGGAFVTEHDGKNYLRGILREPLTIEYIDHYDTYAIFTDVSQYIPWIKNEK